jgi:ATP-dependent protease HslVU (ClpYQ) peptidase subunit
MNIGGFMAKFEEVDLYTKEVLKFWENERAELLKTATERNDKDLEYMQKMFSVADELSNTAIKLTEMKDMFAIEIATFVSSLVMGISSGRGANAVVDMLALMGMMTKDKPDLVDKKYH